MSPRSRRADSSWSSIACPWKDSCLRRHCRIARSTWRSGSRGRMHAPVGSFGRAIPCVFRSWPWICAFVGASSVSSAFRGEDCGPDIAAARRMVARGAAGVVRSRVNDDMVVDDPGRRRRIEAVAVNDPGRRPRIEAVAVDDPGRSPQIEAVAADDPSRRSVDAEARVRGPAAEDLPVRAPAVLPRAEPEDRRRDLAREAANRAANDDA